MNYSKLSPDKKEWILKTAWKRMTLQQIANEVGVSIGVISQLYHLHGIEAMKRRDLIASKLIDMYCNDGTSMHSIKEIALILDCSYVLVKEIIEEYGLDIKPKQYSMKKEDKPPTEKELKLMAIKEYEERVKAIKNARPDFTKYTQSGSDLTDAVSGISTTLRPKTYLTNVDI